LVRMFIGMRNLRGAPGSGLIILVKRNWRTGRSFAYGSMSLSASFWLFGCALSTCCMPSAYFGKSLDSAASTGALSTGMMFAQQSGFRSAIVMTVFAPIECRILEIVLLQECLYIIRQCSVVVDFVVGRLAVVSRVDGVYGSFKVARKHTMGIISIYALREVVWLSYLATLWLFLLLPNKPCIITMGSPLALPESS
jgi:hypothetical protein